ncbi:MAG: lipid A deacylase LpxR family protein [Rhodothermaceae bacterium]|nr:lipid A deacylase LpxR family protein [Rhodothermaceae bacterium]
MRLALIVLLMLLGLAAAQAQSLDAVRLRVDNDFFALRFARTPLDWDYTHGAELTLRFEGALSWTHAGLLLPPTERLGETSHLTVGQRIYTPRLEGETPVPGERPFAGWLYVNGRVEAMTAMRVSALELELGATGPPALGEPAQNGLHRLVGSRPREGWANQLPFEPALALYGEQGLRLHAPSLLGGEVELQPRAGIGLGTLWTGAYTDGRVLYRVGATRRVGASLEGGVRGSWVLHDLFLDGTVFRESLQAERIPLVGEAWIGAELRVATWSGGARFVVRSRQYQAQPRADLFGSLTLARHF